MEGKKHQYIGTLVYIIYFAGIVGHILEPTRELTISLTPIVLTITAIVIGIDAFISQKRSNRSKLVFWMLLIAVSMFFLEAVGTKTGAIFGEYSYGSALGPKFLDTPLIIGANWIIVILGGLSLATQLGIKKHLPLIAASAAVLFDAFLEVTAIKLDYWFWDTVYVPAQNYLVWFLVVWIAATIYLGINLKIPKLAWQIFVAQLVFLATVAIAL